MVKTGLASAFLILIGGAVWATQPDGGSKGPLPESKTILVKKVIPPRKNPYPPLSPQNQKRVKMAEEIIPLFWNRKIDRNQLAEWRKLPHDPLDEDLSRSPVEKNFKDKSLDCLKEASCWVKDYPFLAQVDGIQSHSTFVFSPKILHVHVVPWAMRRFEQRGLPEAQQTLNDDLKILEAMQKDYASTEEPLAFSIPIPQLKKDEYLVDAIVQFKDSETWWHLNLVMTENAAGEIFFRRFVTEPIQDLTRQTIYVNN